MVPFSGHTHGGEVYSIARRLGTTPDKLLDFSSNANIFACHLTEALVRDTAYPFLHYPDSRNSCLAEALAAHEQVESDRILPGNGGADLIWLFLRAFCPRKIFFVGPIFSEYIRACQALDIACEIVTPPAENDFTCTMTQLQRLWETDADLVILCTPNNPATVTYSNMQVFFQMLRAPQVLIDNSYREFLFGSEDYERNHLNAYQAMARPGIALFTLHSFTKFFCCPGLRLGYLMGDRAQISKIAAMQPSWTVSPFAQIMGQQFLTHLDHYRETLPLLFNSVAHTGRELRRLDCMIPERVFEGPGFLCCGLASGFNASTVSKTLVNQGLVVRNCDTIPGMPPGYIRIQARPEKDAALLLEALSHLAPDRRQHRSCSF